jgi:hypothetical protein
MITGVTGTVEGATAAQLQNLSALLLTSDVDELHHGDAIGADAQAHEIALSAGAKRVTRLVVHPPDIDDKRAFCTGYDAIRPPFPYLVRDHHIVDEIELLIAVPKSAAEVLRSGTWATVRYARKRKKMIIRLNPDGSVSLG